MCHACTLTESYEEFSVASALVRGQREDAGDIIPIWRLFLLQNRNHLHVFTVCGRCTNMHITVWGRQTYFGKVADYVRPLFVDFSEDVEDEGLNVEI